MDMDEWLRKSYLWKTMSSAFNSTTSIPNPTTNTTRPYRGRRRRSRSQTNPSDPLTFTLTPPTPDLPTMSEFELTALPPQPPNWEDSCDLALEAMTPFTKIPVTPTSLEYKVIGELIPSGVLINQIERVVNLELWKKFLVTRKELLCAKSRDLELCKALGLSEKELHQKAHIAMNFDPPVGIPEDYSDNVALLWHCTKGNNVEAILSEGLDERLAHGGTFGRGIYFADDPLKSMEYDTQNVLLLFAVYLGDCSVSSVLPHGQRLVREPQKQPEQRRNPSDLFFDSIVGGKSRNNYVIFNRTQCCPLYVVSYEGNGRIIRCPRPPSAGDPRLDPFRARPDLYIQTRSRPPPFALGGPHKSKSNRNPDTGTHSNSHWPFFATTIFDLMKKKSDPEPDVVDNFSPCLNSVKSVDVDNVSACAVMNGPTRARPDGSDVDDTLPRPREPQPDPDPDLGLDPDSVPPLHSQNIENPSKPSVSPRTAAANAAMARATKIREMTMTTTPSPSPRPTAEECPICCMEYSDPCDWKQLNCDHKLCTNCYGSIEKKGTRMSGKSETFFKCPFCQSCSIGEEIGDCPNGRMRVSTTSTPCAGYEGHSTLVINYSVAHPKYRLNRTAYLPYSPEGNRILNLLRIAWDRRLIFSIGNSLGSGRQDVLVWNIHHKTSMNGGVQRYGYPDPTYFQRVLAELKQYGIQ